MTISNILFIIFALFAVFGGLDRIFGNRLGACDAFERGIMTMTGMLVLAPVLIVGILTTGPFSFAVAP